MDSRKGQVSVTTENIFPIIRQWLYSDQDIFMRELVSNCADAISKYKRLIELGKAEGKAEGEAEGMAKGQTEIAKAMLKNGLSVKMVSACTGLAKDVVESLK